MAEKRLDLIINAILEDKKFKSGMRSMVTTTEKAGKSTSGFLQKMKANWLGITAAVVGVGLAFKKIINVAKEFEQAIANVAAVAGGSQKALAKLAREAGTKTVFSAKEAADALYFLASAGLSVQDMNKVLVPTLDLAAAAQLGIAEATDIVVNNLKVFGAEMSDAGRFTDIMATTVRSSNTDMRQLSEALKTAGPIASSAGIDFQELNVVIAAMADRGIKGSRAGIQLRQALARLIKPTAEAQKALAKYGISVDEVQKLLPTPIKLFKRLNEAGISQADMLGILGVRQAGLSGLIQDGIPTLEKLTDKMKDYEGASAEMAKVQVTTVSGALKLLKSQWEEFLLMLSSDALPTLRKMITGLSDFIKMITSAARQSKQNKEDLEIAVDVWKEYNVETKKQVLAVSKLSAAYKEQEEAIKALSKAQKTLDLMEMNQASDEQIKAQVAGIEKLEKVVKSSGKQMEKYKKQLKETNIATGVEAVEAMDKFIEKAEELKELTEDVPEPLPPEPDEVIIESAIMTAEELKRIQDEYQEYINTERENDLLKEQEKYEKLLAFAIKNGNDTEAVEKKHKENLTKIDDKYNKERTAAEKKFHTTRQELADTFTTSFLSGIKDMSSNSTDVLRSMADTFVSFISGKLRALSAFYFIEGNIPGGIAALAAAGAVKAYGASAIARSFEEGTDSVPETGQALIHAGERIIPADINPAGISNEDLIGAAMRGVDIPIQQNGGSSSQDNRAYEDNRQYTYNGEEQQVGGVAELDRMAERQNTKWNRR